MTSRRLLCYPDLHNSLLALARYFSANRRAVPRDFDLARGDAYLVAAHAAIENYVETLCRRVLHASLLKLKVTGARNKLLREIERSFIAKQIAQLPRGESPFYGGMRALALSTKWYVGRIDDNNGVKSNNLLALWLPLGYRETDFDPLWLNSMDSFGRGRGDMAHGRPMSPAGRPPIAIGGTGGVTIGVWTPEAIRPRLAQPVWEVQATVDSLRPELLAWDRKLTAAIDLS